VPRDANLAALRAHAEASAARRRGEHDKAARQETLAASYQAMHDAYRARETELDTAIRDQQATEHDNRRRLRLADADADADAADAELRHRYPRQPWPPLPAAEPQPSPGCGHGQEDDRGHGIATGSGHSPGRGRESQSSARATGLAETSRQVEAAAARHGDLAARLTEHHSLSIPAEDPAHDISLAIPLTSARRRTAILQPPKPEIQPSPRVLERLADRDLDLDLEAAD